MRLNLLIFAVIFGFGVSAQEAQQPEETTAIAARTAVTATDFMVVTAHPDATEVGRAILAEGGSAADAAIAIQLVLNLVEPQSSGLGGGAFALYWDAAAQRLSSWDGREAAPMSATPDYWLQPDGTPIAWFDAVVGGRSVGVPGTLKLLETLHGKFGTLPWVDLFTPAISMAEDGFLVSPRMAQSVAFAQGFGLNRFAAARRYFFAVDGAPIAAGSRLTNRAYAKTLRLIAHQGSAPFYFGTLAADIVAAVRTDTNAGELTLADLGRYRVKERPPVCVDYRGYQVCGMGPPSSGGLTVGQILKLLEPFDLGDHGRSPLSAHLLAEAGKLAYADRAKYMADSDFLDVPVRGLLDPSYLAGRSAMISPHAVLPVAEAGAPPWDEAHLLAPDTSRERPGTSHFVVIDQRGDMISMTTTIETGFGSRVMTGGFLLNNELTDFSLAPSIDGVLIANRVEGGKRPRSSMAPTIVLQDGQPVLLTGSPGGSRIIGYVAQSIVAVLDWGMDPQQAADLGHVINRNGVTELEEGADSAAFATRLMGMGHDVAVRNLNSGLHIIQIEEGRLIGGADKRREGLVAGQ